MGKAARFFAAGFDTVVIGVLAFNETGGRFAATFSEYVLWGSVLAAGIWLTWKNSISVKLSLPISSWHRLLPRTNTSSGVE